MMLPSKFSKRFHLLFPFCFKFFFLFQLSNCDAEIYREKLPKIDCPRSEFSELYVERRVTPYGNTTAGAYEKVPDVTTLPDCVKTCCQKDTCDVVFMFNSSCFLITCSTDKDCDSIPRTGDKFDEAYMVRVGMAGSDSNGSYMHTSADVDSYLESSNHASEGPIYEVSSLSDEASEESKINKIRTCIYGIFEDCSVNEICVLRNNRARHGLCACKNDFVRDGNSVCQAVPITNEVPTTTLSTLTSTTSIKHLVVSAGDDKLLYLPENSVTISAFALPKPPDGESYKFEWTLVSHFEGNEPGSMEDQNTPNLKLSKLSPGIYTFKVLVTGIGAQGESQVNVTVLPAKQANKPPVAIIQPDNVTVQLPNRDTVLDGSFSKDYNKIVKYHWEAVAEPIGYKAAMNDTPTLQLKNLIPGFYRFKLTVTDSQSASNFTFANVTVLKEIDYPPTANAGDDVVIFLPKNEVYLNGNASMDDKGIKSWQWQHMKNSDANQPVDVEGTTSPFLHLSHLDVGVYKFQLKVTDTADQTSTAEVRVFVKPVNNKPPTANAGPDVKVSLPLDGPVDIDGRGSSDDATPSKWLWEQISGPKPARLEDSDKEKLKVYSLVPGEYTFQLTIFDSKGVNGTDQVNVIVTQTKNLPPKANAGGDRTVFLPAGVITLNGSSSSDDVEIISFKWTREPSSLAIGDIVEDSSTKPLLKLINFIPGRYLFRLTVADAQGATGTDTTSLIVKSSPDLIHQVEMVFNADIKTFTYEQLDVLLKQLELLVHSSDSGAVQLINLSADRLSRRVTLIFVVKKESVSSEIKSDQLVDAPQVVYRLKHKLRTDSSLLNLEVLSIHTVVCQNICSNHGSCDPYTKRCICEAFWMENFFRAHFGDEEANCDWSILYVIILLIVILISLIGAVWALTCSCTRMRFMKPKRKPRYMLLEEFSEKDFRENSLPKGRGKEQHSSVMVSESDSDTIFESRSRPLLNANGYKANGIVRKVRA